MLKWKKSPDPNIVPDKDVAIRAMGGGGTSLESAAAAAPESTTDTVATPSSSRPAPRRSRGKSTAEPISPQLPVQSQAEIEKETKRQAALQKMSEMMLSDMAGAPYEMWAAIANDDDMKLSPEESQELGEAYAIVAETLGAGKMLPPWLMCPLFILGRNSRLVRKRMKLMEENQEKKLIANFEKNKRPAN
jgi:hypothetical protein